MFFIQLFIGTIFICVTVVIHALVLDRLILINDKYKNDIRLKMGKFWKIPILIYSVLGTFLAHVIQIWLWAIFYEWIDVFPSFTDCLYFSTTAFTTVGFGDVVLPQEWKLVGSFEAANGFMLFGWTTAFIFEMMSSLYRHENSSEG